MNRLNRLNDGLVFYGLALSQVGVLGILFFWLIGFFLDRNAGTIAFATSLEPFRILFYAYPFVAFACVILSWLLYGLRWFGPALLTSGLPLAGAFLYYLVMVMTYVGRV